MTRSLRLVAILALVPLTAPVVTAAGRIVPKAAEGIEVAEIAGRPTARGPAGPLGFMTAVTTGDGFLYLHLVLENRSSGMVELSEKTVKLLSSDGSRPKPLAPRTYVDLRFKVQPVELDANGRPVETEASQSLSAAERAQGKSMMEVFTNTDRVDEEMQKRVEATKEIQLLEKSMLTKGTYLESGAKTLEKLVFQRNHVELPFVVEIAAGGASTRVTFDREP